MKKLTFIQKSLSVHGNTYDYSQIPEEFSTRDKVCIICRKHGKFWLRADLHYSNHGCPKCGHEQTGLKTRTKNLDVTVTVNFECIKNPKVPYENYIIGSIYLFKNKINNKVYIGQTYNKYSERWTSHKNATDNFYIHRAIRKYGWDSFEKYVLKLSEYYINTPDNIKLLVSWLNYWEIFYIKLFQSNDSKRGYNLTSGGKDNYPEFLEIINKNPVKKSNSKKVEQYDLFGNLIRTWGSIKELLQNTNFKYDGISDCSKGKRDSYKNYKWKIISKNSDINKISPITAPKPILLYDLDGNFISEWESGTLVKRKLGIDDHLVRGCCNRTYNTSKNYIWVFKDNFPNIPNKLPIEELELRNLDSRILLYDLNENLIKIWNNSSEAALALSLNRNGIAKCARGDGHTSQGFIWRHSTLRKLVELQLIDY